jgi:hypothetical protein
MFARSKSHPASFHAPKMLLGELFCRLDDDGCFGGIRFRISSECHSSQAQFLLLENDV